MASRASLNFDGSETLAACLTPAFSMLVITATGLPWCVTRVGSLLAAARTSSAKRAFASLIPTDFMKLPQLLATRTHMKLWLRVTSSAPCGGPQPSATLHPKEAPTRARGDAARSISRKMSRKMSRPGAVDIKEVDARVGAWIAYAEHADTWRLRRAIFRGGRFDPAKALDAWTAPCRRVVRGGSWNNNPDNFRSANRNQEHHRQPEQQPRFSGSPARFPPEPARSRSRRAI